MRKRIRRTCQPKTEPNLTSLLDITFVLLLAFMVVAPAINKGVELDLPEVKAAETMRNAKPINLAVQWINDSPAIYVDRKVIEPDDMIAELTRLGALADPPKPITLSADKRVDWQVVAQIIADLRSAGMTSIGIVTDVKKS
ncbi:MAG: ExbD/TolR family protein [Sumerlaeia bacterium]